MKVRDFESLGSWFLWFNFLPEIEVFFFFPTGLALLRFKERVIVDPFGALLDWKEEGGEVHPCSWFGVECSDGKVVAL